MNKTSIPVPQLPRSMPEEQGIQSSAISAFLNRIKESQLALHSFMLLRHGHVVAEGWWAPYSPERRHMLFSLSKSFTATAIGLAAAEQLLSLEDKVISFFPEEAPGNPGSHLAGMNIRHLLMMGTGHTSDTMPEMMKDAEGNWVRAFLQLPVDREPGSHFLYNTGATYMLSAILQKVTGQTLLDFLHPRLFSPLGIINPVWDSCPRGINTGGFGLSITTEDIARFGQLYLQKGLWNGKQLLPQEWVAEASALQIQNGDGKPDSGDWSQGYGYQFWRCRHGLYRGDGAFGQFCIVMPEQDAVVAITSGTHQMQEVMNAVWELLLPALNDIQPELGQQASAAEQLAGQLRSLSIIPPEIKPLSALESSINGQTYQLESNDLQIDALSISISDNEARLTLQDQHGGSQELILGRGAWAASQVRLMPGPAAPDAMMSSFTWTAEDTLQLTLLMVEQPFIFTIEITFSEQSLTLTQSANVSMGAPEPVTIKGRIQA
ncbi:MULTISPECIES: serine hydrolase [unclassified Paenibacillus]|nr:MULTISPECIES: serine hydrolase [unclassified Paenibacillus]